MLDIIPIIPDRPEKIKEPYSLALSKIIRNNEHKLLNSYVKYEGNTVRIELTLKNDSELSEQLQEIIRQQYIQDQGISLEAMDFIEELRNRRESDLNDRPNF